MARAVARSKLSGGHRLWVIQPFRASHKLSKAGRHAPAKPLCPWGAHAHRHRSDPWMAWTQPTVASSHSRLTSGVHCLSPFRVGVRPPRGRVGMLGHHRRYRTPTGASRPPEGLGAVLSPVEDGNPYRPPRPGPTGGRPSQAEREPRGLWRTPGTRFAHGEADRQQQQDGQQQAAVPVGKGVADGPQRGQ